MPKTIGSAGRCNVVVLWIDWYAYHIARLRGILSVPELARTTVGIEMVGGVGVHAGLKFRQPLPPDLPIETLLPHTDWLRANKWQLARAVWAALSRLSPQVVMVPGYYTLPAVAAALWAKLHGRTSVLMTESASYDHVRTGWKEWCKGVVIRTLFDWAISGGEDHVTYLRQLGFPADRIAGSYDVVDNRMYRDGVSALRNASAGVPTPFFLFVGRLSPEKNVVAMLEAWLSYRGAGGTWKLVLAGDGPERAALESLAAASAHAGAFTITGLKSSEELLHDYAAASAFVLPSTREPWGLVVNEAMASGLPVLVSNRCGCARDLVKEGVNGFVFDPFDTAALPALLHRMEQFGPAAREEMGRQGQRRIANYSPEQFGGEVARIVAARTARHSPEPLEYANG